MNPYVLRRVSGNPKCPRNDSNCSSSASLKEAQREGSVMRSESGGRCKSSASLLKQGHFPQVSTRTQDRNRVFNDLSYAQRDTLSSAIMDDTTSTLIVLVQTLLHLHFSFSVGAYSTSQPIS